MLAKNTLHLNEEKLHRVGEEMISRAMKMHEKRFILGIAGIPGSGKSTLAMRLLNTLEKVRPGVSRLMPMDGFHQPNKVLEQRRIRQQKGKPETIDAKNYVQLIKRAAWRNQDFHFPIYDRTVHEPIWAETEGQHVHEGIRLIITEGNYLLWKAAPWDQLSSLFSRSWFVDCDPKLARERLMRRHQLGGRSWSNSCVHYAASDYPNTRLILNESLPADDLIVWE